MKKLTWLTTALIFSAVMAIAFLIITFANDGCFPFLCSSLNIPTKGLGGSEVGVDYTKLSHLLALGKFEQADLETAEKILAVMGREKEGNLSRNQIEQFPCQDLATINKLWLGYSGGKFGITVQRALYQKISKDLTSHPRKNIKQNQNIEQDTFDIFAETIRWKTKGKPLSQDELPINPNGGKGYLPRTYLKLEGCNGIRFSLCLLGYPWYSAAPDLTQQFFSRATICKL